MAGIILCCGGGATVLVTAYGKKNPCVVRAPHTDPQPLLPDASRPLLLLEQTIIARVVLRP